jgi:predicted transcriptional regulator
MDYLSTIIAVIGCVLLIATFYLGRQSSAKLDAREMGKIIAKLETIEAGISEIKQDQRSQAESYTRIIERVANLEASCKSAHKRLDKLTGGGDGAT